MTLLMNFLSGLFATAVLLAPLTSSAEVPEVDPDRAVVIDGPIANGNVLSLVKSMNAAAATGDEPLDIIIDSPGGEVFTGSLFINEMENFRGRGFTIRCFVPSFAVSMAFQILVHCSERYTLDKSFLLWHGARISVGGDLFSGPETITEQDAARLAKELASVNRAILDELDAALGLPKNVVRYHFRAETLHMGKDLARMAPGFIKSYPYIPGLMSTWKASQTPRLPKSKGPFDSLFGGIRIVHMYLGKLGLR